MPFTISHIAAVLPFSRPLARWRLLSATLIGSMVPDFGFLSPWRLSRATTHGAWGLLTFCLPVGLVTFWLFQNLVKPALMAVLPDGAFARWQPWGAPADPQSLSQWMLAACGIEFGAGTHLVWDAFTHEGARGMRIFPLLDDPIVEIAGHTLIGARLLQDLSSLVGLLLVLAVALFGLRRADPGSPKPPRLLERTERWAWALAYAAAATAFVGSYFILHPPLEAPGHSLGTVIESAAIAVLRGLAAAVVVVSLALQWRMRAAQAPRAGQESG